MTHVGTIDQIISERRKEHPDDALTKNALRRLVVTGEIQSVKVGAKYLVRFEAVDEYIKNPQSLTREIAQTGRIRRICKESGC